MQNADPGRHQPAVRARLTVHAGPRPLPELLSLASAASRSGTSLNFTGMSGRPIEDLMRLAVAGGEAVSFGADVRAEIGDEAPEPTRSPGGVRRLLGRLAVF